MSPYDPQTLSQDTAFDLLSNVRRRFVLRQLQERPAGIDLSDLAEELAAEENDVNTEELTAQQRKRTYVSLYQTHIPKLSEAGVVEYDADTGMVYPTPHVDELGQYFREQEPGVNWQFIYGAVALGGLLLYVFALTVGIPSLDPMVVGFIVLASVTLVSATHYVYGEKLVSKPEIPIDR